MVLNSLGRAALAATATMASAPAWAAGESVAIPEPTDLTLFAIGVVGLIVGRYAAKKRPRD